jgi:hypothetical protein
MRSRNAAIAVLCTAVAIQACGLKDYTFTADSGTGPGANLYARCSGNSDCGSDPSTPCLISTPFGLCSRVCPSDSVCDGGICIDQRCRPRCSGGNCNAFGSQFRCNRFTFPDGGFQDACVGS